MKDGVIERLASLTSRYGQQCWVIEFDGRNVQVYSGKSSWSKINHAKSALTNAIGNKSILKELEAEGRLKFVNIASEQSC